MRFISACKYNLSCFAEDSRVYWDKRGNMSLLQSLLYVITCHGWHVMFFFRLGKIIYAIPVPVVSHLLKVIFQISWFLLTTFYGIWIDLAASIGKGFYIGHFGCIILAGDFGDYCSVGQGVTVGYKGAGKSDKWPTIGNNVYIGAGAKVVGSITVGDNCIVGANAVVVKTVPASHRATGVPAMIRPLSPLSQSIV